MWVANRNDGTVNRIDRASADARSARPIGVGNEPAGIFVGRKFVWVTNSGDDTVNRIDPSLAQVVGGPIHVGTDPRGVIETTDAAWIVNAEGRHRDPPGPQDRQAARHDPVGKDPRQIARGFGSLWVTNHGDNTRHADRRAHRKIVGSAIPVGDEPLGIATGAGSVWVANHESNTVTRIQP